MKSIHNDIFWIHVLKLVGVLMPVTAVLKACRPPFFHLLFFINILTLLPFAVFIDILTLLPFAVFYKYINDFLAAVKSPPPQKKLKSLLNPDLVDPYKRKYATWAEMEQVDDGGAAALKFGDQRAFDLFVEKQRYVSLIQSFF